MNKKKKSIFLGPVIMIIILIAIIMIASAIFSIFQVGGQVTSISNGTLETSLVTVNNLLSSAGIKFILSNAITNFQKLSPVILLIIVLLGIGICEKSGLFKIVFSKLKKVPTPTLIFFTIFLSVISSIIGENSFIILIPVVGIAYKYANRNAMMGILISFISICLGYGFGLIFNYDDYLLGTLTAASASLDVDKNYKYQLLSNIYMLIAFTFIFSILGSIIINAFLVPKFEVIKKYEKEETIESKKGLLFSTIAFVVMLLIVVYMIIPGLNGSGLLLDKNSNIYIAQLFSNNSPFSNSLIFIFSIIMMVCGLIYGRVSGNIKNTNEFSIGLGYSFDNLGYVFVLLFFFSQMIALLDWSNIGTVLGTIIIDKISLLQLSGVLLIIIFFLAIVFIGIFIPSTLTKWTIASPIIIPLFMRANITPDFTQFIFRVADGIGKCITPMYIYFFIMMAFMQKYNYDNEHNITIFGTLKLMSSTVLILSLLLLLLLVLWYIIGLPMGLQMYPTL